jgi:hypothetical protein
MEYSKLASGQVTGVTGGIIPVYLPFLPNLVEIDNFTSATTPASGKVAKTLWYSDMAQDSAIQYVFNATPVLTTQTQTSGGISTFTAGSPQLGGSIAISGITKASSAVVTATGSHGLSTGDVVIMTGLAQSSTTGMQQIAGIPFVITVTGSTTFTIPFNTNQTNFTALSGSPSGAVIRKVLYPYLYFPSLNFITAITTGSTTTISTSTNHNLVVGQEVAFRIGSTFGTTQLNTPTSIGNPVYGVVTSVSSATAVVVNIISSSFTAFVSNQTVAQALAGLTWAQMVTVGDTNTGVVTNSNTPNYSSTLPNNSIWAPTVGGAFQNNTRQGFLIGINSSGTTSDAMYWRAYAMDYPT